jgi:hypothetical protein
VWVGWGWGSVVWERSGGGVEFVRWRLDELSVEYSDVWEFHEFLF